MTDSVSRIPPGIRLPGSLPPVENQQVFAAEKEVDSWASYAQKYIQAWHTFSFETPTPPDSLTRSSQYTFVENPCLSQLSIKLLGMIHGDAFIGETDLRGGSLRENAQFLVSYLESYEKDLLTDQDLRCLKTLTEDITQLKPEEFEKQLRSLNPGESKLLGGGWQGNPGHVLIFEFFKRENGHLDIFLYNTGSGLEDHSARIFSSDLPHRDYKIKPILKYEDVSLEELGGKEAVVFRELQRLGVSQKNSDLTETNYPIRLYKKIFGHLAPKISNPDQDFIGLMGDQRSGTCSWKALMALMRRFIHHSHLEKHQANGALPKQTAQKLQKESLEKYKKFKFFLKLHSLSYFYQKRYKKDEPDEDKTRLVLRQAVDKLERSLLKLEGMLDVATVKAVYETLEKIKADLEHIEKEKKLEKLRDRKKSPLAKFTLSVPPLTTDLFGDSIRSLGKHLLIPSSNPPNMNEAIPKFAKFKCAPENLLSYLKHSLDSQIQIKDRLVCALHIEQLCRELPLSSVFWLGVPEKDVNPSLTLLGMALDLYSKSVLQPTCELPSQMNTAVSLFAMIHQLAIRMDPRLLPYKICIEPYKDAIKDSSLIFFEPNELRRRQEILNHFQTAPDSTQKMLFNFQEMREISSDTLKEEPFGEIAFLYDVIKEDPRLKSKIEKYSKTHPDKRLQTSTIAAYLLLASPEIFEDLNLKPYLALRKAAFLSQLFSGLAVAHKPQEENPTLRCEDDPSGENHPESIGLQFCYGSILMGADSNFIRMHRPCQDENMQDLLKKDIFNRNRAHRPSESKVLVSWKPPSKPSGAGLDALFASIHLEPSIGLHRLLHHYQQNLDLLTDSDGQTLFELMFFEPVLKDGCPESVPLFEEIETNPAFLDHCALFINRGIDHFSNKPLKPDIMGGLFFVRLYARVFYTQQDTWNWDHLIRLNQWLLRADLTPEERSSIHLHRLTYLIKAPKKDQDIWLQMIVSWVYSQFQPQHPQWREKSLEFQARQFIYSQREEIEKTLTDPNVLLQNILTACGLKLSVNTVWSGSCQFPVYTLKNTQGDSWSVNLLTGKIYNEKGVISPAQIPDFSNDPDYQTLCGNDQFSCFQVASSFQFSHPEYGDIRLYHASPGSGSKYIIQRKIEGEWYQYFPRRVIGAIFEKSKGEWSIPLNLISDYAHWMPLQGEKRILFTDLQSKQPSYVMWPGMIRVIKDSLSASGILALSHIPASPFCNFEKQSNHIFEFDFNPDRITNVSFPRYSLNGAPLRFYFSQQGEAILEANPQYRLVDVKKDIGGVVGTIRQGLILRHENGSEKLLLPMREVTSNRRFGNHSTLDIHDKGVLDYDNGQHHRSDLCHIPHKVRYQVLEFDLVKGKVHSLSLEGTLFLCYLYLAQREYLKSYFYLKQLPQKVDFSAACHDIFYWITFSTYRNGDISSNAVAICNHARLLFEDQPLGLQITPGLLTSDLSRIIKIYFSNNIYNYRKSQNNVLAELKLSKDQLTRLEMLSPDSKSRWFNVTRVGFRYQTESSLCLKNNLCVLEEVECEKSLVETLGWGPNKAGDGVFCDRFASYYHEVKAAKNIEEITAVQVRIRIDGLLYPSSSRYLKTILPDKVIIALLHFGLRYPNKLPELPEENAKPEIKIKWLKKLIEDYKTTAQLSIEEARTTCNCAECIALNSSSKRGDIPSDLNVTTSLVDIVSEMSLKEEPLPLKVKLLEKSEADFTSLNLEKLKDDFFEMAEHLQSPGSPIPLKFSSPSKGEEYERVIEAEIEEFIQECRSAPLEEEMRYQFKQDKTPSLLKKSLAEKIKQQKKQVQRLKRAILSLANRTAEAPKVALRQKILESSGVVKKLKLVDVIEIFSKGRYETFQKENPRLKREEIPYLVHLIQLYLIDVTQLQQAERALKVASSIISNRSKAQLQSEEDELIRQLVAELGSKPHYLPHENPLLLVFEYRANLRIRKKQAALIEKMCERATSKEGPGKFKDCVVQLMMGGGKTTVLASLLLKIAAQEGRLAVFLVPSSQFETVKQNLSASQKRNFWQAVEAIDLSYEAFTLDHLEQVYARLEAASKMGSAVLLKPELLLKFLLEYLRLLHQLTIHSDSNKEKRVSCLLKILFMFMTQGDGILDEVDYLLRSNYAVNFPIGEPKHLPLSHIDLLRAVMELHLRDDVFIPALDKSIQKLVGLDKNKQHYLPIEEYTALIRPVIAGLLFDTYFQQICPEEYRLTWKEEKVEFVKFVCGENPSDRFIQTLTSLSSSSDQELAEMADLVTTAKYFLYEILPLTLSQVTDRNYGRLKDSAEHKVIPFRGVDTPDVTEDGNPYVAAVKHFQTAAFHKISSEQLIACATRLTANGKRASNKKEMALEETIEAEKFLEITSVRLSEIMLPGKVEQAVNFVNQNISRVFAIEAETIAQVVKHYPEYLSAGPQELAALLSTRRGYSGTPWNYHGYPDSLSKHVVLDPGFEGRVAQTLRTRSKHMPHPIHYIEKIGIPEVLEVVERQDRLYALGDSGGIFNGFTNEQVARDILAFYKDDPRIQTELFFARKPESLPTDSPDHLMAVKKGTTSLLYIGETRQETVIRHCESSSTFVYYDDLHCTGMDLPLPSNAVIIVTLGAGQTRRGFMQALTRARKYLYQQDVELVMPKDAQQQFINGGKTLDDVLLTLNVNQAKQKGNDNLEATKQKITDKGRIIRSLILDGDKEIRTDLGSIIADFKAYAPLLITRKQDNLHLFNMRFSRPIDTSQYLRRQAEAQRNLIENNAPGQLPAFDAHIKTLDFESRFLPSLVEDKGLGDEDMQVMLEVMAEQVQQVEMLSTELQRELETYLNLPRDDQIIRDTFWKDKLIQQIISQVIETNAQAFPSNIYVLKTVFDQKYQRDYGSIFSPQIGITKNCLTNTVTPSVVFHPSQKQADDILVWVKESQLFLLLLSAYEASYFKDYLSRIRPQNAWLVLPSGKEISSHPHSQTLENDLENLLLQLNFFNGNALYLHQHDAETAEFLKRDKELKLAYLRLKVETQPLQKAAFMENEQLNPEVQKESSRSLVRHGYDRFQRAVVKQLQTPVQIATISPNFVCFITNNELIKHLKTKEQIQALNRAQLRYIDVSMVSDLSDSQLKLLTREDLINGVPTERLKELSQKQIRKLDSSNVPRVPKEKISDLGPSQIPHVAIENLGDLSNAQIASVSPLQVLYLPKEKLRYLTTPEQLDAVDLKWIKRGQLGDSQIPLLHKPAQIRSVPDEQLRYLVESQVQCLELPRQIGLLQPNQIPYLLPKQVPHLPRQKLKYLTTPEQLDAVDPKLIPYGHLSTTQIRLLRLPEQITSVSYSDSSNLLGYQIQHIQDSRQINFLPNNRISDLFPKQVPLLEKEKLRYLTTPEQLDAVAPELIAEGWLVKTQIPLLRLPEQIRRVPDKQICYLLENQVQYLELPSQINLLGESQIRGLLPTQICHLENSKLQFLTTLEQLDAVAPELIMGHWIRFDQIPLLRLPEQIRNVPDKQIRYLTAKQVCHLGLDEKKIQEVSCESLEGLEERQLDQLSSKQIEQIPSDIIPKLSAHKVSLLTSDKLKYLVTPAQLNSLAHDQYIHLTNEQLVTKYGGITSSFALALVGLIAYVGKVIAMVTGLYFLRFISLKIDQLIFTPMDQQICKLFIAYRILRS